MEIIQNRAIRAFLGVHRFAPNLGLQGDVGWNSTAVGRNLCTLRLWNRLLKLPDNRILKQVFRYDYNKCTNNWSQGVKAILENINMGNIFDNLETCNLDLALEKLHANENKEWKDKLVFKPKLRTYLQFKDTLEVEKYIKFNLTPCERSHMAQLRLGILPLALETGRYSMKNGKREWMTLPFIFSIWKTME